MSHLDGPLPGDAEYRRDESERGSVWFIYFLFLVFFVGGFVLGVCVS